MEILHTVWVGSTKELQVALVFQWWQAFGPCCFLCWGGGHLVQQSLLLYHISCKFPVDFFLLSVAEVSSALSCKLLFEKSTVLVECFSQQVFKEQSFPVSGRSHWPLCCRSCSSYSHKSHTCTELDSLTSITPHMHTCPSQKSYGSNYSTIYCQKFVVVWEARVAKNRFCACTLPSEYSAVPISPTCP